MSTGGDNIFARWARRKQAVQDSETPAPNQEEGAFDRPADEAGTRPDEQEMAAAGSDAVEPVEPLPRLEDLTAESDLSAFLRKGVPETLKSAALRKVWSLDPTIRDYIGPSEYAWDFNQPGSMAGFGPLDAKETVSEFLATMSAGARGGFERAAVPAETPRTPSERSAAPEQDAGAALDDLADAASGDDNPEPASPQSLSSDQVAGKAEDAEHPDEQSRPAARPRHGGAIPH